MADPADDSVQELKGLVRQALEKEGAMGKLRAQLRACVLTCLNRTGLSDGPLYITSDKTRAFKQGSLALLLSRLVREHLIFHELDHTDSILASEAALPERASSHDDILAEMPDAARERLGEKERAQRSNPISLLGLIVGDWLGMIDAPLPEQGTPRSEPQSVTQQLSASLSVKLSGPPARRPGSASASPHRDRSPKSASLNRDPAAPVSPMIDRTLSEQGSLSPMARPHRSSPGSHPIAPPPVPAAAPAAAAPAAAVSDGAQSPGVVSDRYSEEGFDADSADEGLGDTKPAASLKQSSGAAPHSPEMRDAGGAGAVPDAAPGAQQAAAQEVDDGPEDATLSSGKGPFDSDPDHEQVEFEDTAGELHDSEIEVEPDPAGAPVAAPAAAPAPATAPAAAPAPAAADAQRPPERPSSDHQRPANGRDKPGSGGGLYDSRSDGSSSNEDPFKPSDAIKAASDPSDDKMSDYIGSDSSDIDLGGGGKGDSDIEAGDSSDDAF
eukprot:TRINITY_DN4131_c0_g1_i1.p1 TRINITY_DN4131_c0_g1~~TRINITY_DN4131_c0_g1_i1.p1  ORF type:complete len:523 (+),score=96.44 TRINITY_DN4131_c0_g1_i1:81-1571(+)